MEYRIEELEGFKIVGFVKHSTNENMQGMQDCPAFWGEVLGSGKNEQVVPLIDHKPFGLIGASVYNTDKQDAKKFDYYIAAATTKETPVGMEEYQVPAMTWAIFPCTRETSGKTQMDIINVWGPASDYELLNTGYMTGEMASAAPDLEVYGMGNDIEIWVPVRSK